MKNYIFALISMLIILSGFLACKKGDDNSAPKDDYKDYSFSEPEITGNTFYIDPFNGSINGDGSEQNPWRTLQEVYEAGLIQTYKHAENYNADSEWVLVNEDAPVKGGDKLILLNGYHGYLSINNFLFKDWITIEGKAAHNAVFSQIKLNGAFKNIHFKNITVQKDSYTGNGNYWDSDDINYNTNACVYLGSNDFHGKGSNVKLQGIKVRTVGDISNWTANQWVVQAASGISLRSVENIEVIDCDIRNISMGISIEYNSDNSKVVGNKIVNYCLDGARLISNNVYFAYNTIAGCYKVDDNHDDAIQSYSRGEDNSPGTGVLFNNVIRGNLIVGILDLNHPLKGNPQGIGCFDGFFDGWTIENNVIITNHYHGISFYGMKNSKIANNTVVDQIPGDDLSPWIRVGDHKNGSESVNCLIANNIVMRSITAEGNNVTEKNNYIIGHDNFSMLADIFANPIDFNLRLIINDITNEHIIDKGEAINGLVSSEIDKDKEPRTLPPDIGAYESR